MAKKARPRMKAVAVVTIYGAPGMTVRGRSDIVRWLYAQASWLMQHGPRLGPRYTARYRI